MRVGGRQPSSRVTGRRVSHTSGTRALRPNWYRRQAGGVSKAKLRLYNSNTRRLIRQPVTSKLGFHDSRYFHSRCQRLDRRTRTKSKVMRTDGQDQGRKQGDELKSVRHSSNRRNRNRIRKKLSKDIQCNRARKDITAEEKEREDKRLLKLLETYQRPQREP